MKYLTILVKEIYPEKEFSLKQECTVNDEGEVESSFQLWIEGRESEYFTEYEELEKFISGLSESRILGDAIDISRGINPYEYFEDNNEGE